MDAILEKAKLLLNADENEVIKLKTLLEIVEEEVVEQTKVASIDAISSSLLLKMLIFKYKKLGYEALKSQDHNGITENYMEDYPEDILRSLDSYKKKMRCF